MRLGENFSFLSEFPTPVRPTHRGDTFTNFTVHCHWHSQSLSMSIYHNQAKANANAICHASAQSLHESQYYMSIVKTQYDNNFDNIHAMEGHFYGIYMGCLNLSDARIISSGHSC